MNNLKVKYFEVPEEIIEQMNEVFCMGWHQSNDDDATEVKFINVDGYNGFRLLVGNRVVYFDYHSECYLIQ